MPVAKPKYLVANGDLATGNFAPWSKKFGDWYEITNKTEDTLLP
jgi:hypothetical protein